MVVLADSGDKNTKGLEALLMNADEKATSEFALRIAVLLALRLALGIITAWCFAWGTVVLILRVAFATPRPFLLWGLAGVLPAAVLAFRPLRSATQKSPSTPGWTRCLSVFSKREVSGPRSAQVVAHVFCTSTAGYAL